MGGEEKRTRGDKERGQNEGSDGQEEKRIRRGGWRKRGEVINRGRGKAVIYI